jgi:hypothetical protein
MRERAQSSSAPSLTSIRHDSEASESISGAVVIAMVVMVMMVVIIAAGDDVAGDDARTVVAMMMVMVVMFVILRRLHVAFHWLGLDGIDGLQQGERVGDRIEQLAI